MNNSTSTFVKYEKSPNSFLPGLPRSIINQFHFHNFLCLCLASVHLPHPFHLVVGFQLSRSRRTRFASFGTISSMRFRAASSILAQYCLTYTQLWRGGHFFCADNEKALDLFPITWYNGFAINKEILIHGRFRGIKSTNPRFFQRKPGLFSVSIIQKGTISLWYL